MKRKRLGQALVERQRISHEMLDKITQEQDASGAQLGFLGEILLARGLVARDDLVAALEEVTPFRFVDPRSVTVEKAVLELVPRAAAVRYCALPLAREGNRIITVMAEPQNLQTVDDLRFMTGTDISPRLGFRSDILAAIEKHYAESVEAAQAEQDKLPFMEQVDVSTMQFFTASSSEKSKAAIEEFEAELRNQRTPTVRLVSAILYAAATKRASDIHIEPQALATTVRIRIDGVLRELTQIPKELQTSVISRIKILSDMDIAERRNSQDGRFLVQISDRHLDLRVSTLPTHYGEKVVMRLLDPEATSVPFMELGFSEENARTLDTALSAPQGMLLVTGPTGSGKTTTLYSALNSLRSPTVNIITVEDPIEYKVAGINQVQINPKTGLTFANCLRSVLRQDPNIIMIGEIRDAETAEIALQAAQTGHFVLSTLHTNDSISAITRLLDLGPPAFLVASSVSAVVAQRLVRKLCECRNVAAMTNEYASRFLAAGIVDIGSKIYIPVGCPRCDSSGFKGRVAISEVLILDEQIRAAIRSGMRDEEIRDMARSGGLHLMQEDALEKVDQGLTTLEEVLRVVPFENIQAQRCRNCGKSLAPSFLFCPFCGAGARQVPTSAPVSPLQRSGALGGVRS
jgi:type IV pilus assembly protein PilB